ncbi:TerB family tellurite resistance protein [Mucilaginibacter sp. HMF5004]|uniref:TerB family tellurite resistance protein n=1 Tax=Mucilaginibacter rivuli TaxID=2857527 RepID=UPI001C5F2628|nr:TerB family tellurite resistance protein [Mucilaginibacter rivuli]MBW4888960.1 TerB family tellurite resistance protein [Mucilaginibacter rivuli]
MKKKVIIICIGLLTAGMFPRTGKAQSIAQLTEQLALDYQKLAGLKSILSQMYTGYEVLSKGYHTVKDVSQGNFSLHEAFLDGLLIVSPAVRKYPRVADIINDQSAMISEYHSAYAGFRQDKHFSPDEVSYMLTVYNNLVSASLKNLDDLSMVMSDSKMRMSDAERLAAIDRIYTGGHGQLAFLRSFNDRNYRVAVQRARDAGDQRDIKNLYGIN